MKDKREIFYKPVDSQMPTSTRAVPNWNPEVGTQIWVVRLDGRNPKNHHLLRPTVPLPPRVPQEEAGTESRSSISYIPVAPQQYNMPPHAQSSLNRNGEYEFSQF